MWKSCISNPGRRHAIENWLDLIGSFPFKPDPDRREGGGQTWARISVSNNNNWNRHWFGFSNYIGESIILPRAKFKYGDIVFRIYFIFQIGKCRCSKLNRFKIILFDILIILRDHGSLHLLTSWSNFRNRTSPRLVNDIPPCHFLPRTLKAQMQKSLVTNGTKTVPLPAGNRTKAW